MEASKTLIEVITAEVLNCQKCPLHETRKNAVPGEGNPNAKIVLIGEAPGHWEDIKGRPFVGAAGKFLDSLLAEISLKREDVFICNVLKCRPPQNREPAPNEINMCTPYLDRQINAIKPQFIITLGNYSTAYMLSKAEIPFEGITKQHGKAYETKILNMPVTIYPTFHPAVALYNPKYKRQITEDFRKLARKLRETVTIP